MLDALRSLMVPPALAVLAGVVGTVAAFARLFRRSSGDETVRSHEIVSSERLGEHGSGASTR
jgi:hypothetical protein